MHVCPTNSQVQVILMLKLFQLMRARETERYSCVLASSVIIKCVALGEGQGTIERDTIRSELFMSHSLVTTSRRRWNLNRSGHRM